MLAIINIITKLKANKCIRLWEYSSKQDNLNPVITDFSKNDFKQTIRNMTIMKKYRVLWVLVQRDLRPQGSLSICQR